MPMPNPLRRRFDEEDRPLFGVFTVLDDPAVVEIIAMAGFDFSGLEMEHGPYGVRALENHVRAGAAAGIGTVVKLPADDPHLLLRTLETGVDGVLLAAAPDVATVRAAVQACRYAPDGTRGVSTIVRGAGYGSAGMSPEALAARNRELVVGVLVESPGVIQQIDSLRDVAGIDYLFVGVADLAGSLGNGEIASPEAVAEAVDKVIALCNRAAIPFGLPLEHPAYTRTAAQLREIGTRMVIATSDGRALLEGLRAVRERART